MSCKAIQNFVTGSCTSWRERREGVVNQLLDSLPHKSSRHTIFRATNNYWVNQDRNSGEKRRKKAVGRRNRHDIRRWRRFRRIAPAAASTQKRFGARGRHWSKVKAPDRESRAQNTRVLIWTLEICLISLTCKKVWQQAWYNVIQCDAMRGEAAVGHDTPFQNVWCRKTRS